MRFGYREACLDHETGPRHPESPDRLRAVRQALEGCYGVDYVDASPADRDRLEAVHDPAYVSELESFCESGGGQWDADTTAVAGTWDAALASAGLAQWAAEAALAGADGRETPFALGRPPGHHAKSDDAAGFCFFNNVAIAAQAVLDDGTADRVAIVDWDVHHGDGTQEIFYDRDDVFFVSFHEAALYPGTGAVDETGTGDGAGTTCNFPFPQGTSDAAYLAAIAEVVAPALESFDPDLVLISAGFDAHEHDPISRIRVSTEGYGLLADRLREVAATSDAGLAFVLEGGYGLDTLSESIRTVHEVFDGYEPAESDEEVSDAAREVIDDVLAQGLGER